MYENNKSEEMETVVFRQESSDGKIKYIKVQRPKKAA